jgi:alginate biosynthesis protein Alg44
MNQSVKGIHLAHKISTRRQHVRAPLPARILIHGRKYETKNISTGGCLIEDIDMSFMQEGPFSMDLELTCGRLFLHLPLEAEARHYEENSRELGCAFLSPGSEQVSLLNHALTAFTAGDAIAADDFLGIASRTNFTKTRTDSGEETDPGRKQRWGLLSMMTVGLFLLSLLGGLLYNHFFTLKSAEASVNGSLAEVFAPMDGIYHARIHLYADIIQAGQVIGVITPTDGTGREFTIKSPCACRIVSLEKEEGAFVSQGQKIARLIPATEKPWISVDIDPARATAIGMNMPVTFTILGSPLRYSGHVSTIQPSISGTSPDFASVKILPDKEIPLHLINRPALVLFKDAQHAP